MKKTNPLRAPLKSWDLFSVSLWQQAIFFEKQTEIEFLTKYKEKYGWVFDVDTVLNNNSYDALVLTNLNQEIQWVSNGFKKMTGYPVSYAKGKKPKFLQGEKTSQEVLKTIKENIKKGLSFEETIINYRKNKELYNCNITIYPLRNENNKICHLLALEREVYL